MYHTTRQWSGYVSHDQAVVRVCITRPGSGQGMYHTTRQWSGYVPHDQAVVRVCTTRPGSGQGMYHTTRQWSGYVPHDQAVVRVCTTRPGSGIDKTGKAVEKQMSPFGHKKVNKSQTSHYRYQVVRFVFK
ncbi:hypothetical protein BgiMline_011291 [Biomphalaria glabrata]